MRPGVTSRLGFVPIVAAPATAVPEVVPPAADLSPSIEVALAGAVLRVAPGIDGALLATVLRAIRASAA
jgi:transposase